MTMVTGYDINELFEQAGIRWLKPAEVLFILQNHDNNRFSRHVSHKPTSGSLFLFDKNVVPSFRGDAHNWKKKMVKKKGKGVEMKAKETHMFLKVDKIRALNCYYAHGEDNPRFKRRCYWMLDGENKHIVLVHYRDEGEANPASASGPSYTFIEGETNLENQGIAYLNDMHGSSQSICSLVAEQQGMNHVHNFNGFGSGSTSPEVGSRQFWQGVLDIASDNQKQNTNGTANSAVLGCDNGAHELGQGATFPHGCYGRDDGMLSDSTVPTTLEEIGSLLFPHEAEMFELPACLGSTAMDTYIPHPGQLQMALEVDPSITIAPDHKFKVRKILPEWGFAYEATEVYVIGSFPCNATETSWACMFGDTKVPIQIIQDGVLCCQAPPNRPAGKVTVCITSANQEPCSEIKDFEYRDRNNTCNNCCRPKKEENTSMEEVQLTVRFVQMLLSNASLQKGNQDSKGNSTEALETGCGKFDTIDQVLQELLEDILQQWLSPPFLEEGDNLSCTLSKKEQGIIHVAAALGCEWALNFILNSGVGVNFRDNKGWTALHWAARFGREKMAAALIASGASADAKDPKCKTPASIADANGHKGLAGYLSELELTSHPSSITLEAGFVHAEAEVDVSNVSGEDQHSMKQALAACRNAAQAADLIRAALREDSFRKRQQRESANCSSVSIQSLSAASRLVFPCSRGDTVAAVTIQKHYRGWKKRKEFLTLRQRVVKIQARIRGHRVRKYYRVVWAVGIMEKAVLRWRRKGAGLRGYKPVRESIDDEDILKDFRRQIVDTVINEALSRVHFMIRCPEARKQYTRMLETVRQAKAKLGILGIQEELALVAQAPPGSPDYCEAWQLLADSDSIESRQ